MLWGPVSICNPLFKAEEGESCTGFSIRFDRCRRRLEVAFLIAGELKTGLWKMIALV
jgi:hypothetical protein